MSFSLTRLSSGTVLRHLFRVPGTSLSLPVYFLSGTSPGATLLVHAALHGSEVVGVEVIHRLLETLAPRDISGRVILVPVVNIPAFEEGRRCFSQTNQDLNRVFPGRSNGTLTERIAHLYFHKLVRCSDAIVDLHSTESPVLMLPHVRQRVLQPTQAHRDLMRATGLSALWIGPGVLGMLQVQAAGIGKPCVTVEIGSTADVREQDVKTGIRVVRNVLKFLKMIPGRTSLAKRDIVVQNTVPWYGSTNTGLFRVAVQLGQSVEKGELLATIFEPVASRTIELKASYAGTVFGVQQSPQVRRGEQLILVAPE